MRWAGALLQILCYNLILWRPTTLGMLDGTPVSCVEEGKEVSVPIVANNSCFRCFCEDRKVVCTSHRRCSDTSNCYMIVVPKPPESCCEEVCKGCEYGDKSYASDETWTDPKEPCTTMECKAGIITRTKQLCHVPCRNPIHIPGQCCPACTGCSIGRNTYQRGMTFPDPREPCTNCVCLEDGNIQCSRKACPVLNCPVRNIVHKEGSCCPICQGKRRVFAVTGRCLYHPYNMVYSHGQTILEDACGKCTCQGGTVLCDRLTCPRLSCSAADLLPPENGDCCPRCSLVPRKCRDGSVSHQHGKSWFRDLCTRCYCDDGTMHCRREDCASNTGHCPQQTHELQYVAGACCPQCVEKSATCVVFGDPHYKTFDGLLYTFQGTCRYVLARPCSSKRDFSVTVQNQKAAPPSVAIGHSRAFTESVTVRVAELNITLSRSLRTSVNGMEVTLPYLRIGRVSVVQQGYSVIVLTHVGVRVRWDGGAYTEVVVPRSYKGRMCGLCGNYNGTRDDDWSNRRGQAFGSAAEFGDSWQLPGTCSASPENDTLSHRSSDQSGCGGGYQPTERDDEAALKCSVIKSALYAPCAEALRLDDYYRACVNELCMCPAGQQCLCTVLKAFQKACRERGVKLDVTAPCGG